MTIATRRLAIAAILLIAAGLRLWGLDRSPLWNDELFSWYIGAFPTFAAVITEGVQPDVHPPLYFLFLHLIIHYVGDSAVLLRWPSAIAGIAAVWMLYRLGLRLYSEKEALVAAGLLALSWSGVFYAQDARPYALLLLAVICASYFWVDILRCLERGERPKPAAIAGYCASAIIAAYLHYFGLQIIFLQGVCAGLLFIRRPRALLLCAAIYGALTLAYLPWVPAMLEQLTGHPDFWIKERPLRTALRSQLFESFRFPLWVSAGLVAPALLLAAVTAYRAARGKPARAAFLSSDAIVIGWCALPFVAAYVQSLVAAPVLTPRNLIVTLPAVYLLTARGICAPKSRVLMAVWCILMLVAVSVPLKSYFSKIIKQRFDLVAAYVIEQTDAPIPIVAYTERRPFYDYYFRTFGSPLRVGLLARDGSKIEPFIGGNKSFWFLTGTTEPPSPLSTYLNDHYVVVKSFAPHGASATLYRRR